MTEPAMMASFAILSEAISLKESEAMKIDMVKPIPATRPIPVIIRQFAPPGKAASLDLIPR